MRTLKNLFLVVVVMGIAFGVLLYGKGLFFSFPASSEPVTVIVVKGQSLRSLADSLLKKNIIASSTGLRLWLKVNGTDRKVQAGKYFFVTGEGVFSAARKLTSACALESVVIVQEGLTIEQTARCIAAVFSIDTTEFIGLCKDSVFARRCLGEEVSSLEGYLFPDTYRFPEDLAPEEAIRRMVIRFRTEYAKLDMTSATAQKYSRAELVTLASIVEKEAVLDQERPRIAAVFLNRLKIGWPLGADPTVRYFLRKFTGPLFVSELNSGSPYNTRRFPGLPPGPICSPGIASLEAVVSPTVTNELYFVAKWDGSGAHDFSLTNEEHARKKVLIRQQNSERLKNKEP